MSTSIVALFWVYFDTIVGDLAQWWILWLLTVPYKHIHSSLEEEFYLGTMTETSDSSLCVGADDVFHEISQFCPHNLSLLLTVAQSSGKPLPVGSYT